MIVSIYFLNIKDLGSEWCFLCGIFLSMRKRRLSRIPVPKVKFSVDNLLKRLKTSHLILLALVLIIISEVFYLINTKVFDGSVGKIYARLGIEKEHIVELTEKGFLPNEITIRKGDTVKFTTSRAKPFWPASNLHPTHEIFPEFDHKTPISPDESWSFKFEKAGIWKYHDHIHANFTGKVVVLNEDGSTVSVSTTSCLDLDFAQKQACWDEQLEGVLKQDGIAAAFDFFVELYRTEPGVPKACHGWGHVLGEASYELYAEGVDFELRRESSYCGYGFYHGFIGKLIQQTGDVYKTRDFCDLINERIGSQLPGVYGNCVHGIGHGTTAWMIEDEKFWGNFQAVADEALKFCENLFDTEGELRSCYDGVFNELQQDLYHSDFELSFAEFLEKDDPFFYCRSQEDRHKESCYFEFIGLFGDIFADDIFAATKYVISEIKNPEDADTSIAKLAADFMQDDIVKDDYTRNVQACRMVPNYLFEHCFGGIVNGFVQHGEPEKQHVKGLAFCQSEILTEEERDICYASMMSFSKSTLSTESFLEVCELVNEKYKKVYCEPI